MADFIVVHSAADVKGANLPKKIIQDNSKEDLIRWLKCRGFSANQSESKKGLVERANDVLKHGLDKFVHDPDGELTMSILQQHISDLPPVQPPQLDSWGVDLNKLPQKYSYLTIVEYLLKRQVAIIRTEKPGEKTEFALPVADKPLVKGHNFFASGHVGQIKLNTLAQVTHVWCEVMASMKDAKYVVKVALDNKTSLIVSSNCQCPAGAGGKCNHVAALLFALLDFVMSQRVCPTSVTERPQTWHQPSRKRKRDSKPTVAGKREVKCHVFGKATSKKQPLQGYELYVPVENINIQYDALRTDLMKIRDQHHSIGLLQLLESSEEESDTETVGPHPVQMTPEEVVHKSLNVTPQESAELEERTRGQSTNPEWFRAKQGRITASNAKSCSTGGQPQSVIKKIISCGKPSAKSKSIHMDYGIQNEDVAVQKYVQKMEDGGHQITTMECGIFVDVQNGQLAASPDRIATIDGVKTLLEIKCLSASRDMTPLQAVEAKQSKSTFPFKFIPGTDTILLKEKHTYFHQVQMQMAMTGVHTCSLVIFTNKDVPVSSVPMAFDSGWWERQKVKLLDFHSSHIVPALVLLRFGKENN